jgi:hypothetical protein
MGLGEVIAKSNVQRIVHIATVKQGIVFNANKTLSTVPSAIKNAMKHALAEYVDLGNANMVVKLDITEKGVKTFAVNLVLNNYVIEKLVYVMLFYLKMHLLKVSSR